MNEKEKAELKDDLTKLGSTYPMTDDEMAKLLAKILSKLGYLEPELSAEQIIQEAKRR